MRMCYLVSFFSAGWPAWGKGSVDQPYHQTFLLSVPQPLVSFE